METAHSMYSAAGRRGSTAEEDTGKGGAVEAARRAEEELAQVDCSAVEIAANQIRIMNFQGGGAGDMAAQNALPEAGGEALHLSFNSIRHIQRRSVGNVAVGPGRVLAGRSAGRVEQSVLREQDEGTAGV